MWSDQSTGPLKFLLAYPFIMLTSDTLGGGGLSLVPVCLRIPLMGGSKEKMIIHFSCDIFIFSVLLLSKGTQGP